MSQLSREEQLREALRKSAHIIQDLKGALAAYQEPIAIIGMACRFPGDSDTPDKYWQLLANGRDAMSNLPRHRIQPSHLPGADQAATLVGGFLSQVENFDAAFFGISPREAIVMDPQQRLLLEVAWEALEAAYLLPERLLDSETGVFIGAYNDDYSKILDAHAAFDAQNLLYALIGNQHSVAAGRLAYTLGLVGPAVAVDTACSSSLVALHQACQSLRNQECSLALAGGTHLILYEHWATKTADANDQMFAADGRCKTFDAAADGFARGEGCGLVVLKRLSDAQSAGDPILAVIRGSMVNQDGRSSGLTAPSGPSQQTVIQRALANAGVAAHQVGYIEAHGTGTNLGDPIEIGALNGVFRNRQSPLWVGSVKTNIGHLEATAGIAGVIKVVLAMLHGQIPPHLNFQTPNPHIDWADSPIQIPLTLTPWPVAQQIAGISSFGISGTNAHVVVAAAPPVAPPAPPSPATPSTAERTHHLLPLSAKTAEALHAQLLRYRDHLTQQTTDAFADSCYTAATSRQHFPYRLALVADSTESAVAQLTTMAANRERLVQQTVAAPTTAANSPRIALLFTGQGAQYAGMGRTLYATQPTFRAVIDQCDELLRPLLKTPLHTVLFADASSPDAALVHQTTYTQPALFALEVALATLWQSWGVQPQVLIGHSVGEVAAACVAGVFSLADGLKLIAARGQLMGALPQDGEMVALLASPSCVEAAVAPYAQEVALAAINGPASVVIAGRRAAVRAIVEQLADAGIKSRKLTVSHAFHSPLMEPILAEFRQVTMQISYQKAKMPLIANLTGQLAGDEISTPDYWVRHAREAVRFGDGVATLQTQGVDILLEIGPKPTLLALAQAIYDGQQSDGQHSDGQLVQPAMLASLRENQSDWQPLLESLGSLYTHGVTIDWAAVDRGYGRRRVAALPTYPFQRQPYWVAPTKQQPQAALRPLIDQQLTLPLHNETLFVREFSVESLPFLADHQIYGQVISPAACQLALLLSAAELSFGQTHSLYLTDVVLPQPLVLPAGDAGVRTVQAIFSPQGTNGRGPKQAFKLISTAPSWQPGTTNDTAATHATGYVTAGRNEAAAIVDLAALRQRCTQPRDPATYYASLAAAQLEFGPTFRWIKALWQRERAADDVAPVHPEILGQLECPATLINHAGYLLHPGLLDGCFQVAGATLAGDGLGVETVLPFALSELHLHRPATGQRWWCHAQQTNSYQWDLQLLDESGQLVATLRGFQVRPAAPEAIQSTASWRDWLYEITWQAQAQPQAAQAGAVGKGERWLIFADQRGVGAALAARLRQQGATPVLVYADHTADTGCHQVAAATYHLHPAQAEDYRELFAQTATADSLAGVVHLWSLDAPAVAQAADLINTAQAGAGTALQLVQALLQQRQLAAGLWLVTQGTQAVTPHDELDGFQQAALWGMGQVIELEHPELACVRIDLAGGLDGEQLESQADALLAELTATDIQVPTTPTTAWGRETRIALRGGERYVARLVRYPEPPAADTLTLPAGPYQLAITERGALDRLHLATLTRRPPLADEIEIQVQASGLNFRDLLNLLGLYPGEAGALGLECAGTVTAVGPAVTQFRVGDRVLGLVANAFGQFVTAASHCFAPCPASLTAAAAATIPVAFLTTYYALQTLNQLKPGDRILIHAATGGVGQAAVQFAHYRGAEVYGTASPSKWQCLRDLGVTRIYNSRTLDFAKQIMADTAGQGVNFVLNSLTGEGFIAASLTVLAPNGHFLEISKRDIWSAAQIHAQRPDVHYQPFDLGEVTASDPALLTQMFRELMALFAEGHLRPLPQHCFPLPEASAAFRHMQQARHKGKIVLTYPPQPGLTIQHAASYLITGGLGGIGLAMAKWLANQGAGQLLLLGRSQPTAAVQVELDALRAQGVRVTVAQADVTDGEQVRQLLAQIDPAYPLRGVLHAAGVLDDGALLQQRWDRFAPVLAPKVVGSWVLHVATQSLPLDFFVVCSSIASVVGNRGQANYAAANAFLDAFVHYRRRQGLPALSINWGAWSTVGMAAARLAQAGQPLTKATEGTIAPAQGLAALAHLLAHGANHVSVAPRLATPPTNQAALTSPFYQQISRPALAQNKADTVPTAVKRYEQLLGLTARERQVTLAQLVRDEVAQTLGLATPERIPMTQPLSELGIDSLMALEVKNRLSALLNVTLHATVLFDYPTVNLLTNYLLDLRFADVDNGSQTTPTTSAAMAGVAGNGASYNGAVQHSTTGNGTAQAEPAGGQVVEQLSGAELLALINQLGKDI